MHVARQTPLPAAAVASASEWQARRLSSLARQGSNSKRSFECSAFNTLYIARGGIAQVLRRHNLNWNRRKRKRKHQDPGHLHWWSGAGFFLRDSAPFIDLRLHQAYRSSGCLCVCMSSVKTQPPGNYHPTSLSQTYSNVQHCSRHAFDSGTTHEARIRDAPQSSGLGSAAVQHSISLYHMDI